jgi:hypothetical protein
MASTLTITPPMRLEGFIFTGKYNTNDCQNRMVQFDQMCARIGVQIADEKIERPTNKLYYLGLFLDTEHMVINFPEDI